MSFYAMLSLDLKDTTPDQRSKFNKKLEELNWQKLKSLTTVWTGYLKAETESAALQVTKNTVNSAASFAEISHYDVAVEFGPSQVNSYSI